jgi:subtilisin family serine protease
MKGKLFYLSIGLLCISLIFGHSLVLSRTINGKPVLTGTWRGKSGEYVGGEILVKVKKGVDAKRIDQLLSKNEAYIIRNFDRSGWGIVGCDVKANIFKKIEDFLDNNLIEWAEPNIILYPARTPNDSLFVTYLMQWALDNPGIGTLPKDVDLDGPEAWDIDTGAVSCTIAVLDTGIPLDDNGSLEHEDLNDPDKFILGINTFDTTANVDDLDCHGTSVIGIIGAETNNDSTGIAGICWACRILVVKIGGGPQWSAQTCGDGIRYAYQHGAKVINISGGSPDTSWSPLYLEDIVAEADSAGALIVAAAGNYSSGTILFPAGFASWGRRSGHQNGYRNVIAVSAISRKDTLCDFSSYSNDSLKITVAGFSCATFSTASFNPKSYWYFTGTSAAAPHVSGVAGLLVSHGLGSLADSVRADSVRTVIENTAMDIGDAGWDSLYGYGRVSALNSLMALDGYYPNASGHLNFDATWKDTVYIIGDVLVPDTVTLTIDSGTVIKVLTQDHENWGEDANKCELIVQGKLKVNGTANHRVTFTSTASSPSDTDWYGIRVLNTDSASAIVKYAHIKYADMGITYQNSKDDSVWHCRFLNNGTHAIRTENSSLFISHNLVEDSSSADTLTYGIYSDQVSPTIKDNEIRDCKYGIYVYKGAPPIESNKIVRGGTGLRCHYTSSITAKRNCFTGKFTNYYILNSNGTLNLDSCYMEGDSQNLTPTGVRYENGAGGWIRRCAIYNYSQHGVYATGKTPRPNLDNGYNSIYSVVSGSFVTAIKNVTKTPMGPLLMADRNWWGTDRPDTASSILFEGPVIWTPYLTSAPSIYNACSGFGGAPRVVSATPIAKIFSLSQNYPNPFNPTTVIRFNVHGPQSRDNSSIPITLTIYNILGQKVKTLVDERKFPGTYEVIWDGKDEKGQRLSSGVYFYRVKTENYVEVKKMVLLK